uniref:Meiosis regulator and mRNA stability factor 1 n=1 Tax=Chrysemys picta bellii TaxID=8478 RepID=A0A8C3I5H8_CHRPI|nr:meiosis regulator and mRNA stability factor 1 isoform X1 [Chrysemys picta bellii]XP_042717584.1 meiosis regulator and mRNA stability factor 1 isoform X1 [Chrysemys picta bellii]XP_042717585.1 meiosis regulator and mRNA stability factor 1 isoform X1 [Chrysemys picta bellii]XP_042717586.1 meiosis regulator and mRNA stability factor 1 isoform X1 [Chrysemys picta bellii]
MMEGNRTENLCSRSFGWVQRQDNDAKPWLWKFSNCFSTTEQTSPFSAKPKDYMENKKAVVELKDASSPLHAGSKLFPAVPLPDVHSLQQQQIQLSPSPKVSCCAHGSDSSCTHKMHFGGGAGGGSLIHPGTILDSQSTGTITCQVGSGFAYQSASSLKNAPARSNLAGIASDFPSMCIENNVSSCQHLPCCGKLHFQSCHGNVHKLHQFPALQSCTSSGYFPCSEFTSGATGHLEEHITQSELTSRVCTNSLHLNVAPSVCLKGSHYCNECLSKPTRNSLIDAAKIWPNIPPPSTQTAPISIPMCNGCGTKGTGKETSLLLASSLGKSPQKYGSPEVAITGQVLENLPPIGVFWDIENCSVPTGRSAIAVVQRIREKFFKGHREAEFICVCDISKENKEVIQELNNCQVTVAHINATAKNAADDKLRQSLRRFADTHTAPATVVLVSTDVNFALELSDLRHRHGFQIILVHKNQASEALLHHAHELIRFEEFISDLPPRLPLKMPSCHTLLYVYNLPTNRDSKSVSNRLRRLSDNCGGKVLSISGSSAILRFSNQESAERAHKRMENEDVFGNRIIVSFTPKNKELNETKNSNCVGAEKVKSPKKVNKNPKLCLLSKDSNDQSSNAKTTAGKGLQTHGSAAKPTNVKSLQELCRLESKTIRKIENQQDQLREETLSPQNSNAANLVCLATKNTGIGELSYKCSQKKDTPASRSITNSPIEKKDKDAVVFQVSYPSAFSKLTASRQLSPLLMSQSCWSSRSMSPNLSNRSSPLAFNIVNHTSGTDCLDPFANGADIQISNIDYRLSRKELQQILQEIFSRYGKVKSVELSPHTDYQLKAIIQMENLQEAISAVNNLHRYKIGSKRIQVSLATGAANKSLSQLSSETMSILQDAPACCLPIFKLTEIYEKKFGHKLIASDLYKLTDTVAIRDQGNGRLVCLLPSSQARQSPLGSSQSHDGSSANCSPIIFEELEYHEPICKQHCLNKDFSEHEFDPDSYKIPFVILSLKTFAPQVHSLLQTHEGTVPLLSFPDCYTSEFSDLEMVQEGQGGVPLEHLITCVPGVNIATAQNSIKVVKWIHNKPPPPTTDPWLLRSKSPVGNPQLIQFSREVIDLLKSQPSCIIPVSKFIPTYHHHFAKQCRVSDYGYSKLMELLEAVPHVLQILGMGSKRLLTLTYRAQVKRFTQDLLKLLKSQASKQVIVREFLQAYHWCFSKDWDVTEYGVCELADIISEIPDTTICLSQQDNEMVICIPKRERTQEEIERTKQFSKEVVDLLRHQPHFRMPFNKFIPSYHHHFGRQCKLAYYGFTKLLELFEAIPDVLQVLECGEEKILTLTEVERVKALAAQLVKLLRSQKDNCLMMTDLLTEYSKTFGYTLRLHDYDVSSVLALMQKLCHVVKVADTESGKQIQLINRKSLRTLTAQLLVLMMSWDETTFLSVDELKRHYESIHSAPLNPCEYGFMTLTELLKSLPYLVEVFTNDVAEEYVKLTNLYLFAKNVRSLLHTYHYQQIFLHEFPTAYSKYTGEVLQPKIYGYNSLEELLGAIPQVVWIKGHGHKRIVVLKNDMKTRFSSPSFSPADHVDDHGNQLTDSNGHMESLGSTTLMELKLGTPSDVSNQTEQELLCLTNTSPVDLLCEPVPSCLPSPQLRPDPVILESADLIQFEDRTPPLSEMMILTEEEKNRIVTTVAKGNLSCGPVVSGATENSSVPPYQSSETQLSKEAVDSPAKKQHKNKVKLAANFSLAPVTKL